MTATIQARAEVIDSRILEALTSDDRVMQRGWDLFATYASPKGATTQDAFWCGAIWLFGALVATDETAQRQRIADEVEHHRVRLHELMR